MVFEHHCDTLSIRGPLFKSGIKNKRSIVIGGCELLYNETFRLKKETLFSF